MATKAQLLRKPKVESNSIPTGFTSRDGSFPSTWEPDSGDALTGRILDYRTIPTKTKAGESDIVTVQEEKTGLQWSVWLSGANLKGRITKKDKGKRLYIKRLEDGKATKKGRNPMKRYIVAVGK